MGGMRAVILTLALLLTPFPAPSARAAVMADEAIPDSLRAGLDRFEAVVRGKDIRHVWVRDALAPLFRDDEGRDRFLLGFVASVRRAGVTDGRVRRTRLELRDYDAGLGYAEFDLRVCGRWYQWVPRCTTRRLQWRELDDRWVLIPPDRIRLDTSEI